MVKRTRWIALSMVLAVAAAACGGGKTTGGGSGGGSTAAPSGATTTTNALAAKCKSEPPQASEIGVTTDTITIAVIADTGSPIRPGLFQGSVDAVKAWAAYKNATGGLGCRKVAVKAFDSKLSAVDSKNSLTQACSGTFAAVATTALFLNDMSPAEKCKDRAGATTGLPDLAQLQTEPVQQCSKISFAVLPNAGACPYSGAGQRTFRVADGPLRFLLNKYPGALRGVWVIPQDLPSTISSSMPGFRYAQQLGIKKDAEFGASGLATQSAYTPIAQRIKDNKSTFAQVGLDYKGTVYLRKEAATQGVNSVKVWYCTLQCYDQRLIKEGGSAVEGQWVAMTILPLEDKGSNASLDAFIKYDKKPDGFGLQAWAAAELFGQSVDKIVADKGPNALTRANLLDTIRNTHNFTANGIIPPTDVGGKKGTTCFIMLQVQNRKFVRVQPTEPGKFDCTTGQAGSITLDPIKAFKP